MNDLERNQLDTLTRVRDFGTQNPALFPAAQLAGELMTTITAGVTELSTFAAAHAASLGSARQGTQSRSVARTALHADLAAINQTAHALAFQTAGLDDKFRMPRGSDQDLLAAARAYVTDATPLKNDFIRFGMAADFLDDLTADIAAFEQATAARSHSVGQQTASSAGLDDAMERSMRALKQLDVVMRNVLRDNITQLTAWMTASHIERVAHRRRPTPPPPTPPTP
jgi:hypothetical protein